MTEDIVDKIKDFAPTQIDTFSAATKRRATYSDDSIEKMLTTILKNIDGYNLPKDLAHRYFAIRASMRNNTSSRDSFSNHI